VNRPSETVSAAAASILGALLIILGSFDVAWVDKITAEVMGAIVLLVGWVGAGVTWFISRRQAQGTLGSSPTGQVTNP
jgi:hypothetical protein